MIELDLTQEMVNLNGKTMEEPTGEKVKKEITRPDGTKKEIDAPEMRKITVAAIVANKIATNKKSKDPITHWRWSQTLFQTGKLKVEENEYNYIYNLMDKIAKDGDSNRPDSQNDIVMIRGQVLGAMDACKLKGMQNTTLPPPK